MTCNDEDLFKEAMDDVKPLKDPANVVFLRHKPPVARRRPDDAVDNFLVTALHDVIPLDLPLSYKRDGIQQGVLDKLRGGRYPIEATLNLTRAPVETCRLNLFAFMLRLQRAGVRTVLIIHGKGRNHDSHANIVRSFVARWLAQFDQVQAFCSAQACHGGAGACYVALKKSDIARSENRERFARRGR
ncbi:DNA endonuclease SmrA [Sodalis sp. C49]|uniref:DNA endonuclease SmrA n=1 Tax=unclassified Sodalis (in: enterobacteria) TaxID=2636512 RepID=UPI003965AB7E